MLELEVTECPDPDYLGTWRFEKNQVYLGHPEGDIIPKLDGLPSWGFLLEVWPDGVQAQPHPDLGHWLLNGKRATRPRRLRVGDELTVAGLKLRVLKAEHSDFQTKKAILDARLDELKAAQAPALALVKLLNAKSRREG